MDQYKRYYEHLAKLSRPPNKQIMFLAIVMRRARWDEESKRPLALLTSHDKKSIIKEIGCETVDAARLASQYLSKLCASGILKSIGGGAYLVDPQSYGGHKYISKELRQRNSLIYETRVFTSDDEGEIQTYIITEDGEKIDLT